MKILRRVLLAVSAVMLLAPSTVQVAEMEWLGRLSAMGGAEKENFHKPDATAGGARGHGTAEALIVAPIPFTPLAIQASANFVGGGAQRRWGFSAGPIVAWDGGMSPSMGGKAGVFVQRQYRKYDGSCTDDISTLDFSATWVRPAVSLYFPDLNVDAWLSQAVTSTYKANACEDDRRKVFAPINQFHIQANYFPPVALMGKPGNLELSLGVDVANLWGISHTLGTSAGPAGGIAIMPWQNLEVTLVRGFYDVNHNRYKVNAGLQYYFNIGSKKPDSTLMDMRRKYLEPTLEPGAYGTFWNRKF